MTKRDHIKLDDQTDVAAINPLAGVVAISGVRIFDVGQGDAVAVLDANRQPCFWIDYGGRQGNPFKAPSLDDPDNRMPVGTEDLLMLTHWDEDHWCSARKGTRAIAANWLVPRQIVSPRAVRFSANLALNQRVGCIPEPVIGSVHQFTAMNGDCIRWEKIEDWPGVAAVKEDCNISGVAFSVVKAEPVDEQQVILLSGDAPVNNVAHYAHYANKPYDVIALLAFHHGAGTHWTKETKNMVKSFDPAKVVFSCSVPNSYGHPDRALWGKLLPNVQFEETATSRNRSENYIDILF